MDWNGKVILLTGGTGSFGHKFTEIMLKKYNPKSIRIFSRDELKQWEMEKEFGRDKRLRFFIGDIRDRERLDRAMDGVNVVVHAAALKQVPLCEYNPFEAVKTNVLGAQNVIGAAIDNNVEKVLALSSDKAVNPINLYGATKMCMEKLFIAANAYVGSKRNTRMSCARYGNVIGSRGSVIPLFKKQSADNMVTITDKNMTRFWITLEQSAKFVIKWVEIMRGGEIFVPRIPSMKIVDMADAVTPNCKIKYIGIRPGEKIHESLLTKEEATHTMEYKDFFIIKPEYSWRKTENHPGGKPLVKDFEYNSNDNEEWLTKKAFKEMVNKL